jgi:type I restriction enzyme R subunit
MLTEGIKVTYRKDDEDRGDLVWLIDFDDPEKNDFAVVNQLTVIENNVNKRLDVVLFVNGLPLVVMELKNPTDENATVYSAFKQLQTYKQIIPTLFTYNGLLVVSDGLEAKAGSISAGFSRFMAWKSSDGKVEASPLIGQLEILDCVKYSSQITIRNNGKLSSFSLCQNSLENILMNITISSFPVFRVFHQITTNKSNIRIH